VASLFLVTVRIGGAICQNGNSNLALGEAKEPHAFIACTTEIYIMPTKIVLADDHPIVCEGISRVAHEAGMEIASVATTARDIGDTVKQYRPNVLVTEVRIAGHDALKTLEPLQLEVPECTVVVFSSFTNPTNIARAAALGCHEFIFKSAPVADLIKAIQSAASGEPTRPDSLLVTTKSRMKRSAQFDSGSPLTNRETQVLRHVSMGLKNREIGKSLGISVETVKEHVQNILRKLNVNDRTQAAVWAIRQEFI
jgi:DNA-binding NarL/FixJ family response regulator